MNLTTREETLSRGTPDVLLKEIGRVPKDSAVTVVIEGYMAGPQTKVEKKNAPRYSSSRRRIRTR